MTNICALAALLACVAICQADVRSLFANFQAKRAEEMNVRDTVERVFRALEKRAECRDVGETCRGAPKCCGTAQCYWEDGYTIFSDGLCVKCVKNDQRCQRDAQCCGGLQCDKYGKLHVNGFCKPPRKAGETCFDNDQCEAKDCSIEWYKQSGVCAKP